MKRLIFGLVAMLALSGCTQMIEDQNRKSHEEKISLMKCSTPEISKDYQGNKKEDFANQLNYLASSVASFNRVENIKLRTVRLGLMNNADSKEAISSIIKCTSTQKNKVLQLVQPIFENRKKLTKDKTEKEYLIKAYSEWESYIKNNSGNDDQERTKYDAAISMYKNY
ncbi:membrane lipoprotein lipid attachment site-containing protein [Xenorhabdus sp. SGI240]|uniref:membrane lipoprotein lipid attachment site-containing protein n=1 Tax=Xenorhabdus sp. SGI240 TaxID=3158262 RepID=UPI0032B806B1